MYRALIVDDEKPVRIAIEKLGNWDKFNIIHPVPTASNGQEALAALRELKPQLVFVDMKMPVMDGLTFLAQARPEFPDIQFIIVSGYEDFNYAQGAIRNGVVDYLLKPVVGEDLNRAIESAIKRIDPNFVPGSPGDDSGKYTADQVISIIKSYIEKNYVENIHISMFAEKYFFSKEYLTKQFKLRYGTGIYEYLLQVRMERAKVLLSDESIRIQDAGERVGFADNNYFSKAFRHYFGISPTEFRNQIREENKNRIM